MKPLTMSFTGWKRFNTCAHQDYLYKLGKRPKSSDNRNFVKGSVLHELFESWMGLDTDPEWIIENVQVEWKKYLKKHTVMWKNDADEHENYAKAILWAERLVGMLNGLDLDKGRCQIEKYLEYMIEVDGRPVKMLGYVDVLLPTKSGGWTLLDWKFSENKQVMNPYQLVFYSLLLHKQGADEATDDGAFVFPALQKIFPFQVTQENRDWLLQDIERVCRLIFSGYNTPTENKDDCYFCDVKPFCIKQGGSLKSLGTGRVSIL